MSALVPVKSVRLYLLLFGMVALAWFGITARASAQCSSPANAIVAENCLTGNPDSEWDVSTGDAGNSNIQGFATDISVNQGGTVYFKINTPAKSYTVNIYRMGYYGGMGARKIATVTPSVTLPQSQPTCMKDATTGLIDCGNWGVSASWQVPSTAVSGVYFAHLVRTDSTKGDSHIVFIVRNDASHSKILYQTADESWQAYNFYGDGSLYGPASATFDINSRSYKVSYNRPFSTRSFGVESDTWLFGPEFPMIEWLEQNGYDVSYSTGLDAARNGTLIQNHQIYMDSGHDEYWSGPQRASVQAARDAGVNLAFFSGNEMFWKTRWENSIDGTGTPYRTLVCYKETFAFAKIDPQDPPTWTGTWRDPSFSPPADGGRPENSLTGTLFTVNGPGTDNNGSLSIKVPAADGKMRFWRNTAAATLAPTATYTLPSGTLGYEWDEDKDNGFRPAGAFELSTTKATLTADLLLDYGATYGAGVATHHLMLYRAPSGALVFGSGTVNWSWGLNSNHDNPFTSNNTAPDQNMQQATVNLFADMGVQPGSLQSGIVPASASTDTTPPASVITSPAAGTTLNTGSPITVSGTANDSGGVVAGVEFSGDGGKTWHPATGRASWSYTWQPGVVGPVTLLSRAVDDSGNLENPQNGVAINVLPQNCPCSIWNASATPVSLDSADNNSIEVGVKFRSDSDGSILGIRFYKATTNTGTHVGHLWTSGGTLLGTVTFTGEGKSGWQQATFASAVPVNANTTYVASYYAPAGHYSADTDFFTAAGVDNPPLHALANGVDGSNAVYVYTSSGGFPNNSYAATNYWVDVLYTTSTVHSLSGSLSGPGGAGATVSMSGPTSATTTADGSGNYSFGSLVDGTYTVTPTNTGVTFSPLSKAVTISGASMAGVNFSAVVSNPLSITGSISAGAGALVTLGGAATAVTTADSGGNYSFTGLLGGAYTVTPSETGFLFTPGTTAVNLSGVNATGVNFQAQSCNCTSIWQPSATPALIDGGDPTSVEVGVKFRADTAGYITGLRFYKAATNTGTHTGHLWTSAGVLLASAVFTGETASGWQQVNLANPIFVAANTTYVASYLAPAGHYSASSNYFASSGADAPPVHALANGVDGPNGVYAYTSNGAFPTSTYQSTNYWVDILYSVAGYANISGTISGPGAPGTTVTLSGGSMALSAVADSNGNYTIPGVLNGTYVVTPSAGGAVFVPNTQTVSVSGVNLAGVNFTVPAICPCDTIWQPSTVPAAIDSGDGQAIELGVKFRADADGYVAGVRFYKSGANTGVHAGNLWSSAGVLLATASFSQESASGWQQVLFSKPVPVSANTTYIASYFAPVGHYSADSGLFASAGVDSPPLHALGNGVDGGNGVYSYTSASSFPSSSYGSTGYSVDVIYTPTSTYSVTGTIAGAGGAGAVVTLGGAGNGTATADASGKYGFNGLANGSYTVTPGNAGYGFSPASQTAIVAGAHVLGLNFSSGGQTYSISGTISGAGGPGAAVSLSGAATATTTADASGNFSFAGLTNGSYAVNAASPGFLISPSSQNVTVSGANASGVNFTSGVTTYSISGTISGGGGAQVSLSGVSTATATADASGNYIFAGLSIGTYVVTPSAGGAVFVPNTQTVSVSGVNLAGVNFTVPAICPCDTIWQPSTVPAAIDSGDGQAIELGVKFRADADGYVAGVRFYKSGANTGVHAGNLWSSAGVLLATASFSQESASGWQQVLFSKPVPVSANTTYIASYFAPVGHYSADSGLFASAGVDSPPLHALGNGVDGGNGVYSYTSASSFPSSSYGSTGYSVDVIYTPTSTYSVTGTIAGAGGAGAVVTLGGAGNGTATADASGKYGFNGLANGSYTVTPGNAGYGFSPASQTAIVAGAHVLGLNFSSGGQTYSISGTISGAGGPGAAVSLSGAATATTTADASGNFSFAGLTNGSYTITPNNTGFVFTPVTQSVTINGANASANFTSTAQTYSITGTIGGGGGSGATVKLTGAATVTVTANTSGVYAFTGLANGAYTVTPSKTGFVFTPSSQAVTLSSGNGSANFTSAAQTFSISGTISGSGGSGATVKLTGASTATATANSSGAYTFTGLLNGNYTVTPTKTGFVYTPGSQSVTLNGANASANFSSAVQTYTLSGTVSGAGGSGATIKLTGTATATVTANTSGVYSFTGLLNGTYTVTPSKTGYVYTPASQSVTLNGANGSANFSSVAQTYAITGTVSGSGSGATVKLTGAATATVTANSSGAFTFSGVTSGSYTVTPTKSGSIMIPGNRAVSVATGNVTGVNFFAF